MFSETSYPGYPTSPLSPKLAWQGKRYQGPMMMTHGFPVPIDTIYAPGYGPGEPGFVAPARPYRFPDPRTAAPGPPQVAALDPASPAAPSDAAPEEGSSIMDTISAMPTWQLIAIAAGAYFLFFKKGR